MDVLDIYCDESGFTGQNLLSPDQRFFTYGSVAITRVEASDLVSQTLRDPRLQGNELKGKNLLKHSPGRKAAAEVIRELGSRSQVVIVHKQYALACKLFEYTFEPLISDVSMALYAVNFHKFIANLLHSASLKHHARARTLSERFEQAVRGDDGPLRDFLSVHSPATDDPVEALISFCVYHRDTILRELADTKQGLKWVLDVTATSLNSLLISWARRAPRLRVVCDESGPLGHMLPYFNSFVGMEAKPSIRVGTRRLDFGFNLVGPVAFAKSHEEPGIQLADVVSAVAAAAAQQPSDTWCKAVGRMLFANGSIHPDGIVPEPDRIDFRLPQPRLNALILNELLRRSELGESLTNELPEFVHANYRILQADHPGD